ncbi:MAG: GAF domain-containing protein, partial [Anaerolineae bacterium]|nr:GAF domain-containing protein [Anaerolineae bacterium]
MAGRLQIPLHPTRRSLWMQTLVWVGGVILVFLILLYALSQIILLDGFRDLETQAAQQEIQRTQNMLFAELDVLNTTAMDWAFWDETLDFVQTGDPAYIDANLMDATFDSLGLNLLLFYNTAGELVYGKTYDLAAQREVPFWTDSETIMGNDPAITHLTDPMASIRGIIMLPDGPMYIVTYPILTSHHEGPARGTLTMGRFLTGETVERLSEISPGQVKLFRLTDDTLPADVRASLPTTTKPIIKRMNGQTIVSYIRIDDIHDQPIMALAFAAPRDIYRQSNDLIRSFLVITVLGSIGIIITIAIWLQRSVLTRLTMLSSTVREIGQSGDLDVRVPTGEHTELNSLAESINLMLAGLAESHGEQTRAVDTRTQQLIKERDMLRILIDNLPERLYVKDTQGRFVVANATIARRYELPRAKDLIGKTDFDLQAPDIAQTLFAEEQALMQGEIPVIEHEFNHTFDNAPGWLWTVKLPLRNHEGHIIGLVGIGRDITERKLMENALREAHDELEQRVEERTAELTLANLRLKLEIAEREQVQKALTANERTARDFQEHLKALHEIGLELGQITELDKLYRRAIELGRSQLGFERLGLWRLSQDEQNMIGTFGIDTAGNLRDERHLRNAVTNDPFVQQVLQQPTHLAVWQNKELLDNWEPIGRGWGAMAALWDGSRTIGWLSTDNLLTQTPPSPYQAELLQLYGSALGHHIARLEMEAELRASEHRYSSLFNGVPAPLYRTAPDGQMLEINPALVELLGYTDVKALQQLTVDQLYVQPEMREHWRDVIERENMLRDFETQIVQADGSIIWVQDTAHVVRWPDGSVRYYEGNLKDITARKRAETKLAEAMERLHNHAHELATVAEISRQMTKILDIDQLLWTVCDLIKTNFSLYYAQIYLLDPAGEKLTLAAGSGEEGRALVTHKHNIPVQKSQSLVARAYRTHAPVVTNNVFEAIDFLPNVLLPRTRSEIAVPMLIGDQLIGVLDVQSDILDRFTERDTNIMISLAAQSAIAIHNARLFTENARRLALIENSTDLIALADMKTFELLYINPAGLKLLGLTQPDEFMASRIQDFYPPEIQHTWRRTIRPSLERTGVWRDENTITRADGTNIPVEQTVLAIGEHDAPPHTLATIITDITERKRSEESLQRANRAFHTLSDCNQAMVRATDTINLLNEICQIIVATSGYQMAWASIVDPDQPEQILPIAVAGDECGFLDIIFSDERDPEQHPGPSVRAIRDNRPIVINDIAHDPDYAHFSAHALARSYHSMIALPLVSGEQIIGTLGAYAALPHTFDDQEITLMTELASDLAYGITVLRTRAERQNALHQVRQHEANLTAILENTDASIWSVDRDFRLVACNTGFTQLLALFTDAAVKPGMPVDVLPAERATFWTDLYTRALAGVHFRTEIHYELAEIPGFDMEMALNPIVSDTGEIAGVTVFGRDITARKQHLAQLKQLNDELLALHDMGRTLTATLDIQAIYRLLYEEIAQKRFGAPSFFVSVYDDTEQLITCDFAVIDGGEVNPTQLRPLPLGDSPLSETIRTRQARQVDYPASDEDPPDTGHSIRVGDPTTPYIRSALYMPLISQDRVIGVISLQHYEAEAFRTADLQLLTTLANQAAAAIQNARLFAAEHRQRVYAETLRDIAAAVNKTLNLDNVLSSIFENIKRVVPHDAANIMIIEDGQAHVMGSSIAHHYDLQTWGQSASFDVQN